MFFPNKSQAESARALEASDFGRKHGWFIEKNGGTVGSLDYIRWDEVTQFWHEYRLTWSAGFKAPNSSEEWINQRLVLRNRFYKNVVVTTFMTALVPGKATILIRGASVAVEQLGNALNND